MGFFSWQTSDSKKSIYNSYTDKCRTVYLLRPNGLPAIQEDEYEGYGVFGGVDAYELLAELNFGNKKYRKIAVLAECGSYQEDIERIYVCGMHTSEEEFRIAVKTLKPVIVFERYDSHIPEIGCTMNEAVADNKVVSKNIPLKFPLKFSFNPDAVYENLPAAEACPDQGYF